MAIGPTYRNGYFSGRCPFCGRRGFADDEALAAHIGPSDGLPFSNPYGQTWCDEDSR